ncbi:MAG: (d)CMP kinase [Eubacteriaceae bacterium]|jgi:cytidylate kinase|nr:(d)CMP kinase [Eubacteriaceae bacterium]
MKIALDGPAGAGKSTLAKALAKRCGYTYINTGALYRAFTLKTLNEALDIDDEDVLRKALGEVRMEIEGDNVYLDGNNIKDQIYTPLIDQNISKIASNPTIRQYMSALQKKMADETENVIMEGRDIATVVMPEADIKFFITATVEERARRRMKQNEEKNIFHTYEDTLKDILYRDERDTKRKFAPLMMTKDSIVIDNTGKTLEETIEEMIWIMQKKK